MRSWQDFNQRQWPPAVSSLSPKNSKRILVTAVAVVVALLHFVTGPSYGGPFPEFVNGYMIDILLPLACYFLLSLQDSTPLRHWWVRAALVFAFGCSVEIAQFFGVPVLGATFDPLDFLMYATGAGGGAILDTLLLPRILVFWVPRDGAEC